MKREVRKSERGAALLVALIMLLLITILGVSAMQTTTLEEKMAGNLRDRHVAFQAAEAALRAGEQYAVSNYPSVTGTGTITVPVNGSNVAATYTVTQLQVFTLSLDASSPPDTSGVVVKVQGQSAGLSGVRQVVLESTYRIEN